MKRFQEAFKGSDKFYLADPETERLKQNYLRAVEDDRREKLKNATSGLAYILGGGVPIK